MATLKPRVTESRRASDDGGIFDAGKMPLPSRWGTAARRLAPWAVAGIALAVYARTLAYELVWDDLLLRNVIAYRAQEGGLWQVLNSEFQLSLLSPTGYFRPITLATLWMNAKVLGGAAVGYHLVNIALHAGCSALVFSLCAELGATWWASCLGALLFAVHPVHVESVAFVSGRTDLLAGVFVVGSTILWVRVASGASNHRTRDRLGSISAFALAALAKETAWLLPGILLAWDLVGWGSSEAMRRESWARRNAAWIAGWAAVLVGVLAYRSIVGVPLGTITAQAFEGPIARSIQLIEQLSTYARLLIIPWPLQPYYLPMHVRLGGDDLLALLIMGALSVWGISVGAGRAVTCASAWVLGFLVPALGIIAIPSMLVAERFLYIPSVGLALLLAIALTRWATTLRRKRVGAVVLVGVALLWGAMTMAQEVVWANEVSLFEEAVRRAPASMIARTNLGAAYLREGRLVDAQRVLEDAVRLNPESTDAHRHLAMVLQQTGRFGDAEWAARRALELAPDTPEALAALGAVLLDMRRPAEAVGSLRQSVKGDPSSAESWDLLGVALQQLGRFGDAVEAHERSVALQQGSSSALANLGHAYLGAGRTADARRCFLFALTLDPREAGAHYGLALIYVSIGDIPAARDEARLAVSLDARLGPLLERILGPGNKRSMLPDGGRSP